MWYTEGKNDFKESKKVVFIKKNNPKNLARYTAKNFFKILDYLLSSERKVVVSLPGGRSVKSFFEKIPDMVDLLKKEDWKRVHFFWTDERLVPPDSPQSNYGLARDLFLEELLNRDFLKPDQIHRFSGETSNPERAVKNYYRVLERI